MHVISRNYLIGKVETKWAVPNVRDLFGPGGAPNTPTVGNPYNTALYMTLAKKSRELRNKTATHGTVELRIYESVSSREAIIGLFLINPQVELAYYEFTSYFINLDKNKKKFPPCMPAGPFAPIYHVPAAYKDGQRGPFFAAHRAAIIHREDNHV